MLCTVFMIDGAICWLSRANLERFAAAIQVRGATLENCWAFVDGTVRPISRPGKNQRVLYNGTQENSCYKIPECSSIQWIDS